MFASFYGPEGRFGYDFFLKEVVLDTKDERRRCCLVPVASNLKALDGLALSLIER